MKLQPAKRALDATALQQIPDGKRRNGSNSGLQTMSGVTSAITPTAARKRTFGHFAFVPIQDIGNEALATRVLSGAFQPCVDFWNDYQSGRVNPHAVRGWELPRARTKPSLAA
jgi:hypothetical protein